MAQRTSSRTNKGQDTRIKLEDEQAQQQQAKKPVELPKRQPRRQVEKEQEEEPINKEAPKAPSKSKKTESRTLNLDLSDVPPSDDIKFTEDFSYYTHPFWKDNFYTPKDNTTQEYIEATDKLNDFLPANFRLIKGQPTAFGVANLELNKDLVKPIKRVPLFSKLENGEYQIASSQSDKNISATIKFFRNNLASFVKYKDDDDISWVIHHHRQLVAEILEYYADKDKKSLATIKSRFNAITRIFRIAYETKNYPLYEKYSALVIFLNRQFEDDEFDNVLSEEEMKKFVFFDVVLEKQKELQKQFELVRHKKTAIGYDLNQDLLLVSLYSLIPPLRKEPMTLKFSNTIQQKGDWIVMKNQDNEVLMDLNEIKKKHPSILFNLTNESPELAKILRESYELYPRDYVFTHYKKYPDVSQQASTASLSDRLNTIFSFTGKRVGINALRSSYVSYRNSEAIKNGKQLSVKDKEKIAIKMRSSRKYLDEAYLKIFPIEREEIRQKEPNEKEVQPINEVPPSVRQYNRTKKYYQENREKVLAQQKEYQGKKSLYEKARIKMLYYLNSDPDYHLKLKEKTKQKYNFKKEGDRWI